MKCDKAAGPAGIIAEMLKADREGELSWQDWKRSWSQAHRSSHEAAWMGTRPLHPGDGEQRLNAFYQALCLVECHWCHHRCLPAAGEVHRCWKTALLCFHRPWESIRSCNKEGPLIGHKKSRGPGMSCVCHWGHMYPNARSRVRVNGQYSVEFGVGVGVHQGSVLSPLLFILVVETLSREFHTGVSWELPCGCESSCLASNKANGTTWWLHV